MKVKRLIPAVAMLLISAMLLGTSTYAWFSMNTIVSANNMKVKVVADQGILINEIATAGDANWDNSATTSQTESINLHATSTANTAAWYAAYSTDRNDAAAATAASTKSGKLVDATYYTLGSGDYTTATETVLTAAGGTTAGAVVTYVDSDGDGNYDNGEGYYVKYTYYVKSSAGEITLNTAANGQNLNIKTVTAAGNTSSADLDKALRVAVVLGGKAYIFAPLNTSAGTYYVNASATGTTPLSSTTAQPTALTSLPANTAAGTAIDVYLYFEGEDANLKTSNVTATLDTLTVEVQFELASNGASAVSDNGVAIS